MLMDFEPELTLTYFRDVARRLRDEAKDNLLEAEHFEKLATELGARITPRKSVTLKSIGGRGGRGRRWQQGYTFTSAGIYWTSNTPDRLTPQPIVFPTPSNLEE